MEVEYRQNDKLMQASTRRAIIIGFVSAAVAVTIVQLCLLLWFPWVIQVEILDMGLETSRYVRNPWLFFLGILELVLVLAWWFFFRVATPIQGFGTIVASLFASIVLIISTFAMQKSDGFRDSTRISIDNAIDATIKREIQAPRNRSDLNLDELPLMTVETVSTVKLPEIILYGD